MDLPVHRKLTYPPEIINTLYMAICKHSNVSDNFHENMEAHNMLQKTLEPVLDFRAKELQCPEIDNINELKDLIMEWPLTVLTVELDPWAETLINVCLNQQQKLLEAMYNKN